MINYKEYYIKNKDRIKENRQKRTIRKRVETYLKISDKLPYQVKNILTKNKIIFTTKGKIEIVDISDMKNVDNIIFIYGDCTVEKILYATAKIYVKKLYNYSKKTEQNLVDEKVKAWMVDYATSPKH